MSPSSNPGCLSAILNIFNGGAKETPAAPLQPAVESQEEDLPYRLRDDFLSPAELSFYHVLKTMMGEHFTVCAKVSLADIFFVARPNENRSARNRIDRKHVDFLVCNPKTMEPRFALELDDSSHQRADREERDEFVDRVFERAGLPLLHIPVRETYNTGELGVLFRKALLSAKPEAPAVEDDEPDGEWKVPFCPKCGVRMVLRRAQRGAAAGKQFYGCPNYPKCRVVIEV